MVANFTYLWKRKIFNRVLTHQGSILALVLGGARGVMDTSTRVQILDETD